MTRKYDRSSSLNVKRREQHYGLSAIKAALPLHYLSIQELVIKCFNAGSYGLLRIKICKRINVHFYLLNHFYNMRGSLRNVD
jgi:hypothetical protein